MAQQKQRVTGDAEAKKKAAAEAACAEIRPGMKLGLGTGSTVQYVLEEVARRINNEDQELLCVPTSVRTEKECERLGIPVHTLDLMPHLDLTIDGADELDDELNLIKGGGGALLREKVVAAASKRVVIIADASKHVKELGSTFPVPIEIVPFATRSLWPRIQMQGANVLLREGATKDEPYVTDNGNWIFDAKFARIRDPAAMERTIKLMPGVCEVGIFTRLAHRAYVAGDDGVTTIDRQTP
jgi:ribose 5-phosphate isomerase A